MTTPMEELVRAAGQRAAEAAVTSTERESEAWRALRARLGDEAVSPRGEAPRWGLTAAVAAVLVVVLTAAALLTTSADPSERVFAGRPGHLLASVDEEAAFVRPGAGLGYLWPALDAEALALLELEVHAAGDTSWATDPEQVARRYLERHLGLHVQELTIGLVDIAGMVQADDLPPGDSLDALVARTNAYLREAAYRTEGSTGTLTLRREPWGRIWNVSGQADDVLESSFGMRGEGIAPASMPSPGDGVLRSVVTIYKPGLRRRTDDRRTTTRAGAQLELELRAPYLEVRGDDVNQVGLVRQTYTGADGRRVVTETLVAQQGGGRLGYFAIPDAVNRSGSVDLDGPTSLTFEESRIGTSVRCALVGTEGPAPAGSNRPSTTSTAPRVTPQSSGSNGVSACATDDAFVGGRFDWDLAVVLAPAAGVRADIVGRDGTRVPVALHTRGGFSGAYGGGRLPVAFQPDRVVVIDARDEQIGTGAMTVGVR